MRGNGVDNVLGLARNRRLLELIAAELQAAEAEHKRTGKPARLFTDFRYPTLESWSRERRVVAKAEHLAKGANPRFVVTSLAKSAARGPCTRGILRPRRDGEPDQGASSTCSPTGPDRDDARQPGPAVLLVDRLCAAVGAASPRSAGHRTGASHLRNHPLEAPQNRRPCDGLGQAHQDRHRLGLSASGRLRSRACPAARSTRMSVGSDEGHGTARTTCVRDDSPRSQPASPYCHDAKEPRYGRRAVPKASCHTQNALKSALPRQR